MCASCGKLMGVADECPYCGADNKKVSLRLKRAAAAGAGKSAHPVTTGLVVANAFLFLVALVVGGLQPVSGFFDFGAPDSEMLFRLGSLFPPAVEAGDWWRFITAMFLHGSLLHVFFNMYILWVAGRHMEGEIGSRLMFFVYMTTGIAGFVASYMTGTVETLGASGAVSGVLGFVLVRRRLVDGTFRNPITMWIIQLIVLTAVFGLLVARVDNAAHIGGFVLGAGFAWLLTTVKLSKVGAIGIMLLTTGLVVTTIAAAVSMGLSLTEGSGGDIIGVDRCAREGAQALVRDGIGVDPTAASKAIACFNDTASLGGDAADAREEMIAGLRDAVDAHQGSDVAGEQEAARRFGEGFVAFQSWVRRNAPRFKLMVTGAHERPPTGPRDVEAQ